jgi:hypothetical protein
MAPRKRKTQADRDREWRLGESQSWEIFKPQLERAATFAEAAALLHRAPPDTDPGRHWYRNLGVLLHDSRRPDRANHEELQMYVAFLRRLEASGEFSTEEVEQIIKNLYSVPAS